MLSVFSWQVILGQHLHSFAVLSRVVIYIHNKLVDLFISIKF